MDQEKTLKEALSLLARLAVIKRVGSYYLNEFGRCDYCGFPELNIMHSGHRANCPKLEARRFLESLGIPLQYTYLGAFDEFAGKWDKAFDDEFTGKWNGTGAA